MKKKLPWLIPVLIIAFYLLTHLYQLVLLPVFADEAIYIRWTQLIMDDWHQYLFFPMNDGKTPLMMWLMVPFQYIFSNQLFAGRFTAVLIGLGQILSLSYLTKILGGSKKTRNLTMILGTILPFWYLHHRMALTDALLALGITWTIIGVIQIIHTQQKYVWVGLTALFFGLALWAKLPAVLIIPALPLYIFQTSDRVRNRYKNLALIGLATLGGLLIFYGLRLQPVFPQIFARGSDFLYPWKEVIFQGQWRQTLINLPTYIKYFGAYLTWPMLVLNLMGLFLPNAKQRRIQHLLIWSAMIFVGPIAILGKVVYPRYLFPASIFLTVSAALVIQSLADHFLITPKLTPKKFVIGLSLALLLANIGTMAINFMLISMTNTAQIPFVSADQEQYLYKWSSGHGVKESVDFIKNQAKNQTVAVATEGSFGTLPDGILMYFHRQNVDHIYVEGIGYPVREISPKFRARAQKFDQVLLVVNSHRLEIDLPPENLLQEYCRPNHAPCLQIWEIKNLL